MWEFHFLFSFIPLPCPLTLILFFTLLVIIHNIYVYFVMYKISVDYNETGKSHAWQLLDSNTGHITFLINHHYLNPISAPSLCIPPVQT